MLARKVPHGKTTALRAAFAVTAICMATAPLFADIAMPRIMSHRGESNANVTVNLAGRADLSALARERGLVMSWPEGLGPAASVTFQVDAETRREGFKVVRDDEANGLRFRRSGGFMMIVR